MGCVERPAIGGLRAATVGGVAVSSVCNSWSPTTQAGRRPARADKDGNVETGPARRRTPKLVEPRRFSGHAGTRQGVRVCRVSRVVF